jgi:hypothetical protein
MALNWEAIGAVGEIIGAAAVVLTLGYLARETRKNAQALDATSSREFASRMAEWHREAARDPEIKRILLKSLKPEFEDYSDAEWFEFRLLAVSLFRLYETSFNNMSLGLGNREESENHVRNARSVIDSFPAWRIFWEEEAGSGSFTSSFTEAVNATPSAPDFGFMVEPKSAS